METIEIEIKFNINAGNPSHVKAFTTFMEVIGSEYPETVVKKTPTVKKETVVKKTPTVKKETDKEITLIDLRKAVRLKIENHRPEIKAKLTELGFKNVSTIGEEHFEEFLTFVNSL